MNVLIIEDEKLAALKLSSFLRELEPEIQIMATIESVADAIIFLRLNQSTIDLIFLDIHLSDNLSFEIFKQVDVIKPIIFTTAYDQFALEAFQVFSVDYLLKPINKQKLEGALSKFKKMKTAFDLRNIYEHLDTLILSVQAKGKSYKEKFLTKSGNKLISVPTSNIAYFEADGKYVFLETFDKKRLLVDFTLEDLEAVLNPTLFFRINRSIIIHQQSIVEINTHYTAKLVLLLSPPSKKEITVSEARVREFKLWLDK